MAHEGFRSVSKQLPDGRWVIGYGHMKAAREGLKIDWYAGLMIASAARSLARDPDAASLFLEGGVWPPASRNNNSL